MVAAWDRGRWKEVVLGTLPRTALLSPYTVVSAPFCSLWHPRPLSVLILASSSRPPYRLLTILVAPLPLCLCMLFSLPSILPNSIFTEHKSDFDLLSLKTISYSPDSLCCHPKSSTTCLQTSLLKCIFLLFLSTTKQSHCLKLLCLCFPHGLPCLSSTSGMTLESWTITRGFHCLPHVPKRVSALLGDNDRYLNGRGEGARRGQKSDRCWASSMWNGWTRGI